MAQIEKRGDQNYRIRVFLGRVDGVRKYKEEVFHGTRKAALGRKRDLERDLESGVLKRQGVCTLNEYLDRWLTVAVQPRVAARTYNDYHDLLKRYVRPQLVQSGDRELALGKLMLSDVEPLHIQEIYSSMKKLSPRTIRYAHTVLNNAFRQAIKWRMLKYNPAEGAQLPKRKRHVSIHPLTEDQIPGFVGACSKAEYGVVFLLALTTGLRPEEYLALDWPSIDLEAGTVRVARALIWERKGKGHSFDEPKTPKAKRTVPMPPETVAALMEHRRRQSAARLKSGKWPTLDLVFTTTRGGPIDPDNLNTRHFKPLLTAARLPTATRLYDLRHTWVTLALAGGVSPKTVSEWAGHASVAFTLDTYAHLIPSMEKVGAEQLRNVFSGLLEPESPKEAPGTGWKKA